MQSWRTVIGMMIGTTLLALCLAQTASGQAMGCEGDYLGYQPNPDELSNYLMSETGFIVTYDGSTLWVGDSYRAETFIDGLSLVCNSGSNPTSGGCYKHKTSTSADVNTPFVLTPRGWKTIWAGGNFTHRRKCWMKEAGTSTWELLWNITQSFSVPEPQIGGPGTPIVVPFGKKPEVRFTKRTMPFDITGDGSSEVVAWPIDGGFLVKDRDGDGQITSGKELYGDATFPGVKFNGFDALFHEAGAATIDETVPLYRELKVWKDQNQNGITEPGELEPFSKYVKSLFLFYERSGKRDPSGNVRYFYKGQAVYADGEQRPIYDVILQSEEEQ